MFCESSNRAVAASNSRIFLSLKKTVELNKSYKLLAASIPIWETLSPNCTAVVDARLRRPWAAFISEGLYIWFVTSCLPFCSVNAVHWLTRLFLTPCLKILLSLSTPFTLSPGQLSSDLRCLLRSGSDSSEWLSFVEISLPSELCGSSPTIFRFRFCRRP